MVERVITFTGTLISPEDVDWVKTICVEADSQKLTSGSQTYSEQEMRSQPKNSLEPLHSTMHPLFMLRNCMTGTFWDKGSPAAGRYFIPEHDINHLSRPFNVTALIQYIIKIPN